MPGWFGFGRAGRVRADWLAGAAVARRCRSRCAPERLVGIGSAGALRPLHRRAAARPTAAPASSCSLSASSAPSPSGWPMIWMPIGRPVSSSWSSGTLIAGEPVRFETAVNGVKSAGAHEAATSGRPRRRRRSSPSGTGSSASVGQSTASYCAVHWTIARATPCSMHLDAEVGRRVDALARPRTAPSSAARCPRAVGSRPASCAPNAVCVEIIGAHSTPNCSSSPGIRHGGSSSITSWPRSRSSAAASSSASSTRGSTVAVVDRRRASVIAIRSARGSSRGLARERRPRRRRPGDVAERVAGEDVERDGGVARRARDDAVDAEERVAEERRRR